MKEEVQKKLDKILNLNNTIENKLSIGYFSNKVKGGEKPNVFVSFTYITPNYESLQTFEYVAAMSKVANVYAMQWDINVRANKQFKKFLSNMPDKNSHEIIEEINEEIKNVLKAFGANMENIYLIKSTDMWRKFTKSDLYLKYFRVLSKIKERDYDRAKISHLLQLPLEVVISVNFKELFPEIAEKDIGVMLTHKKRLNLYEEVRRILYDEGVSEEKEPKLIELADFPYYYYDDKIPDWRHGINTIFDLVSKSDNDKEDIKRLVSVLEPEKLELEKKEGIEKIPKEEIEGEFENLPEEKIDITIASIIHEWLQEKKNQYEKEVKKESKEGNRRKRVSSKKEMKNIGSIMRSETAMKILEKCDGKKSVTEIGKELEMQVSNVSNYVKKLEEADLIENLEDKNPKKKSDVLIIEIL